MKHLTALTLALSLLSTAYVQTVYRDDFSGGFNPSLAWSWLLPNNNPENTLDESAVSFTADALRIEMRDGGMFADFNGHRNVPNLVVVDTAPDNWYIETRFRTDWSNFSLFHFIQAGIVIATGADNYFQLLITRDAVGNTATVYGSTNVEENDAFEWGERVTNTWAPDTDWIGLRIQHVPAEGDSPARIELYFAHSGTGGFVLYDGFNGGVYEAGSRQYDWIMNLLSQTGSVRIGVYTDNAGSGQTDAFEFDYFETNLPVQTRVEGDVDGNGCVDDADLLAVLFAFGSDQGGSEDVNNDGIVDDADLLLVLFNFGTGC